PAEAGTPTYRGATCGNRLCRFVRLCGIQRVYAAWEVPAVWAEPCVDRWTIGGVDPPQRRLRPVVAGGKLAPDAGSCQGGWPEDETTLTARRAGAGTGVRRFGGTEGAGAGADDRQRAPSGPRIGEFDARGRPGCGRDRAGCRPGRGRADPRRPSGRVDPAR